MTNLKPELMTRVRFPKLKWGEPVSGLKWENERCIEIPLAQSLMDFWSEGTVLDAGCAMNQHFEDPPVASITHLTQNIKHEDRYQQPNRTYVNGDLRDLSQYPDRHFDRVGCISTLEHVGCDNSNYGGPKEDDPDSVAEAAKELWRVTRHRLFVTVPCYLQPYKEPKWRAFTPPTLFRELLWHWPGAVVRYYALEPEGWRGAYGHPQPDTSGVDSRRVHQIAAILVER